jgi:hypothetical protein
MTSLSKPGLRPLLILICWASLIACASTPTHSAEGDDSVTVTLNAGEKAARVELGSRTYRVKLEQIVDSRCPANAECIWAGELTARLGVTRLDPVAVPREIMLGQDSAPSIEILGARFDLVSIDERSVTFTMRASDEP